MEERASGIEMEQSELDSLLEGTLEREKDDKKELDSKDCEKKSKADKEKATAVRKRAMERMAKLNIDDHENKQKKAKVRRSNADAIDYLRERSNNESEYKKQEIEVRKREIEARCKLKSKIKLANNSRLCFQHRWLKCSSNRASRICKHC